MRAWITCRNIIWNRGHEVSRKDPNDDLFSGSTRSKWEARDKNCNNVVNPMQTTVRSFKMYRWLGKCWRSFQFKTWIRHGKPLGWWLISNLRLRLLANRQTHPVAQLYLSSSPRPLCCMNVGQSNGFRHPLNVASSVYKHLVSTCNGI